MKKKRSAGVYCILGMAVIFYSLPLWIGSGIHAIFAQDPSGTTLPEDKLQEGGLYSIEELNQNQSRQERRFEANAYFYRTKLPPPPPPGIKGPLYVLHPVLSDTLLAQDPVYADVSGSGICMADRVEERPFVSGQRYHFTLGVKNTSIYNEPVNIFRIIDFVKTCTKEMESVIKNKVIGTKLSYHDFPLGDITEVVKEEDILSIELCDCGWVNYKLLEKQCYRVSIGRRYPDYVFIGWHIFLDRDTLEQVKIVGIHTGVAHDVPPYDDPFKLNLPMRTVQVGTRTFVRKIAIPYPDHEPGWRKVISLEEAKAIVNDFFEKNRDKFFDFPGPITEILLFKQALSFRDRSEYARRGTHFTLVYSQQYKGIPVFEASFRIRLTQYGEIITVMNGLALDLTNVPTEPKLTAEDALSCARKVLGDENASSHQGIALFIFPPDRLAWHMNFSGPHHWEMMIDAVSGEMVLQRRNVVK